MIKWAVEIELRWRGCSEGTATAAAGTFAWLMGPFSPSPRPFELQRGSADGRNLPCQIRRGRWGTAEERSGRASLRHGPCTFGVFWEVRDVNPAVPTKFPRFSGQIVLVAPGMSTNGKAQPSLARSPAPGSFGGA